MTVDQALAIVAADIDAHLERLQAPIRGQSHPEPRPARTISKCSWTSTWSSSRRGARRRSPECASRSAPPCSIRSAGRGQSRAIRSRPPDGRPTRLTCWGVFLPGVVAVCGIGATRSRGPWPPGFMVPGSGTGVITSAMAPPAGSRPRSHPAAN